jgi:hypothetical protein
MYYGFGAEAASGGQKMKTIALTALFCAGALALAGCGGGEDEADTNNLSAGAAAPEAIDLNQANGSGSYWDPLPGSGNGAANGAAAAANAAGAEPAGATPTDVGSIVTENGMRYRVGPNDARVRVDAQGQDIPVDAPDPDVPPGTGQE